MTHFLDFKSFIDNFFKDNYIEPDNLGDIELQETIEIKPNRKKYISRQNAIAIADLEKNLRHSMYKDARKNGFDYGLIEIIDYYATLVKHGERFAWYIKVLDGKYGYKEKNKYRIDYFNEDSNISCLVYADDGSYKYLGSNYDTRNIRMVNDDEFIEYIGNVKHKERRNGYEKRK